MRYVQGVETKLFRLVAEAYSFPELGNDWVALIIPIEKVDGSIRIFCDYINNCL